MLEKKSYVNKHSSYWHNKVKVNTRVIFLLTTIIGSIYRNNFIADCYAITVKRNKDKVQESVNERWSKVV